MQCLQSAVVALCGVQVVLLHVVDTLTDQLCRSTGQFLQTLEGEELLPSTDLLKKAERQTATLEKILTKYDAPKSIPKEGKVVSEKKT